jgi:hypothetical protein
MESDQTTEARYRAEAERVRREAEKMIDPDARRQLLDIARQYDVLAATVARRSF